MNVGTKLSIWGVLRVLPLNHASAPPAPYFMHIQNVLCRKKETLCNVQATFYRFCCILYEITLGNRALMTEEELIYGCIREDRTCQQKLYKTYAGKMLVVCMRYCRSRQEAEDILQDGFIRVFDNIKKFTFSGSFEGWVRRIMINCALRNYRKSSYQKEQIGIADDYDIPTDATVYDKLSEMELLELISELPEGYKMVFNLYAIEGYSHKEIADTMGINEGTSRSQLNKARKHLQKRLHEIKGINEPAPKADKILTE
jgi:RNA polymerase sigma factor (sigma-70 family)